METTNIILTLINFHFSTTPILKIHKNTFSNCLIFTPIKNPMKEVELPLILQLRNLRFTYILTLLTSERKLPFFVSSNWTMVPNSKRMETAQTDNLLHLRQFPFKGKQIPRHLCHTVEQVLQDLFLSYTILSLLYQYQTYIGHQSPQTTLQTILNRKMAFVTYGKNKQTNKNNNKNLSDSLMAFKKLGC